MVGRIAVVGAGAVGGYIGGHLSRLGHDVTLIDFWHENIETIRRDGLHLSGMSAEEEYLVRPRTLHLHEVSGLAREEPIEIAIVSVKSYDTEWATTLIKPYLAPNGYILSLQNCINEERIAGIVGWGRVVGAIASRISVELYAPGKVRRQAPKGRADHTVFRVGEVHGRVTDRATALAEMLSGVDGSKVTTNLWGERWSKLCHNGMRNAVSAATGLAGAEIDDDALIRGFVIDLGAEAVRVGQALGYDIEPVGKLDPNTLAQADRDPAARAKIEADIMKEKGAGVRGALQRPSTGQDMMKGRRTEIDFLNGFIADKGREAGVPAPNHDKITQLIRRVERGELPPKPENIAAILS